MMEPTYGEYDRDSVERVGALREQLRAMDSADTMEERVGILSDLFMNGHEGSSGYVKFGNHKIAKNVAIFNMNSATDCPNADTEHCQVPWSDCYAHQSETAYPQALPFRRRQEILWDSVDAETFALALQDLFSRKQRDIVAIRFSQAGDFRNDHDITKVNAIAEIIEPIVYTYSASDYLSWDRATHFTVNASNDRRDYGDRRFGAIAEETDLPDGAVLCPFDKSDGDIKCGECRLCINESGPDVMVTLH